MPYNYLLDRNTRRTLQLDLTNSVLLFDEAHNLETACTEASSFEISTVDLNNAVREIKKRNIELERKEQHPDAASELDMNEKLVQVMQMLIDAIMALNLTR